MERERGSGEGEGQWRGGGSGEGEGQWRGGGVVERRRGSGGGGVVERGRGSGEREGFDLCKCMVCVARLSQSAHSNLHIYLHYLFPEMRDDSDPINPGP